MTFLNSGISFGIFVVVLGGNTSMMSGLSVALWSVSKKVTVGVPKCLKELVAPSVWEFFFSRYRENMKKCSIQELRISNE